MAVCEVDRSRHRASVPWSCSPMFLWKPVEQHLYMISYHEQSSRKQHVNLAVFRKILGVGFIYFKSSHDIKQHSRMFTVVGSRKSVLSLMSS
jgi:hypothetical protein